MNMPILSEVTQLTTVLKKRMSIIISVLITKVMSSSTQVKRKPSTITSVFNKGCGKHLEIQTNKCLSICSSHGPWPLVVSATPRSHFVCFLYNNTVYETRHPSTVAI